ncbi:MAG: glycosyltransferase family 1 protein [Candidatus Levybacteria bacterium]|nr:glycosyltransferase family 1 protein [Candidatus Levybacteria bacterium]
MKIGIDARLWYESGVGRYIRNLVLGLDKRVLTHSFTVFLNSKAYSEVSFKNKNIKKVIADTKWHTLSEQWEFKKTIERENLDLMHFPYFSYPVFYKKPFIITIHDLIIDHYPTGVSSSHALPVYYAKYLAYKQITGRAVRNAKKIIVPSVATKEELAKHYKADIKKIEVIYEGFDPLIKGVKSGKKLVSKNYILYVGNAYPHKNLKSLVSAYLKLRVEVDIDLVCIGRQDFFYEKLERNFSRVHFLHNIDDSELFDYYTNAQLVVAPSLMEGFGLPVLEAMSLSCPVVCSDTKAFAEIGRDAVLYFDPEDTDDLCKKIKTVLQNNEVRNSLIKRGKIRSEKFSWEECVDQTLNIYESCNSV